MRRLHVVILLCLVLIPLSVTVYLGYMSLDRGAQESSAAVRQTLGGRLRDLSGRAFDFIRKEESRLMDLAAASDGLPSSLAALGKTDPEIRQAFLVEDGMFAWPDRSGDNDAYTAFYQRIETLFPDARWTEDSRDEGAPSAEAGWKSWFWSDGEQFLFWRRLDEKRIVGFELIRSAFLSRLAAAFPEVFADEKEGAASRVELRDLRSHVFLQWGGFRNQTARAVADLALDPPLDGWTLQYFADPKLFPGIESQAFWFLLMSGIVLVLVVAGALWYLLRELGRELRDAGNRVSFVNQVSHELKTPLTNIRLYLDLRRSR